MIWSLVGSWVNHSLILFIAFSSMLNNAFFELPNLNLEIFQFFIQCAVFLILLPNFRLVVLKAVFQLYFQLFLFFFNMFILQFSLFKLIDFTSLGFDSSHQLWRLCLQELHRFWILDILMWYELLHFVTLNFLWQNLIHFYILL